MSDLISRSALLNDMQKELEKALNDENMTEFDCKVLMTSALALKDFVNRQPTAYDVDKVEEQVKKYAYSKICYNHSDCPYRNNEKIQCENCGAIGAIDIIRAGGKE